MRERGSRNFIILNDEDMPKTGLKLGDQLKYSHPTNKFSHSIQKDNWGI